MAEEQFKRHIAFKLRINDILIGKPIIEQERFKFLELGNKQIGRVNVIANIVDRYDAEGEKQYSFLTIDDGSGQIKIKAFSDDLHKLKDLTQGQTILLIGLLRYFNSEVYISPEIVRVLEPEYLLIRKKEIEKKQIDATPKPQDKQEITAIKDKILEKIKAAESEGGIETDQIILNLRETSPEVINQEIKKLLEEGIIFEPRPGKLRYLG